MIPSFLLFLVCFLAIGIYSATRRQATSEDYLLAGRQVSPWLTALSAVATNNSGFMFIGLIGATYQTGLSSMWMMVGWISGDYLAWRWVYRQLRERSERMGVVSIPSLLGWSESGRQRAVVVLAALVTLVFLGTYAGAQLTAGSKALHVLFGWDYTAGTLLGAGIVVAYCFAGGIRASVWTDAAQSTAMLLSMFVLLAVALAEIGGLRMLWVSLESIDPALIDWRPRDLRFGFAWYLAGWIMAGVGVLGQPHVMIRALAIDSPDHIRRARRLYFAWYVAFATSAVLVGLACRVLLPLDEEFDSELALPRLAQSTLPGVLVGFILAGLFAATISTADSQILSCSAALTHDLFPRLGQSYMLTKAGTLVVTAAVVLLVFAGSQSVFQLVVLAWSALASSLGPLLALRALGKPVASTLGTAMMFSGLIVVLVWRYVLGFSGAIYEVLPGMAAGFGLYAVARFVAYRFRASDRSA